MTRTAPPAPRLFGRDAELAALRQAARPGRLVAVTGAPGVGKTALIAELVAQQKRALWADLDQARSAEDAWAALGRALGVTLERADAAGPRLARALQGVGVVVLDGAELLEPAAWAAIHRLRRDCPGTSWIVGSVVAPAGADVQLQLEPLAASDAREMLLSRAADRALGRPLDPADPAWARLAERLDGLPLAIELAAGRLSLIGPSVLLDRLEVAVLRGEDRRHSVEGALRFAWGLLNPQERAALTALSPLRGGFTLRAAEGLLGPDALLLLEALRSRSAVVARAERLYALEGLRRIAAEQADEGVVRRFVAFWGGEAARLRALTLGLDSVAGSRGLLDEYENLRAAYDLARGRDPLAAVRLASALVTALRHHGPLWEIDALGDLLATAEAAPPSEAADLLSVYGGALMHLGRIRQVRPVLQAALAHADRAEGEVHGRSVALSEIGWLQLLEGALDPARATFRAAFDAAPGPLGQAMALIRLGAVEHAAGDYEAATRALEAALAVLEGGVSPRLRGGALHNLGVARGEQRRYVEAGDLLELSLRELRDIDRGGYATTLVNRELLRLVTREGGAGRLAEAMELLGAFGSEMTAGLAGIIAALERWAAGDVAAARDLLVEAGARLAAVHPRGAANVRAWRAALEADAQRGEPGRARSLRAELDAALADGAEPDLVAVLAAFGEDEPPPEKPAETLEIQAARRLLDRAPPALRLDREGRWFEAPGGGRVSLARRGSLRLILAALIDLRAARPGAGLAVQELFEAGWPGERVQPDAAAGRVYTAVRELRGMGVGDLLRRETEGYLLDPAVRIEIVG